MPIQTSTAPQPLGTLIAAEFSSAYNRKDVTVASGQGLLKMGTVLGVITASGKYVSSPATGADGSQTAVAVLAEDVDATAADVTATILVGPALVLARQALLFHATVNDNTKRAAKLTQLETAFIRTVGGA